MTAGRRSSFGLLLGERPAGCGGCEHGGMKNDYAWSADIDHIEPLPLARGPSAADIRYIGELWVSTAYDDLRRAGPDRATQVRWILRGPGIRAGDGDRPAELQPDRRPGRTCPGSGDRSH
jgi:hypothetical protein